MQQARNRTPGRRSAVASTVIGTALLVGWIAAYVVTDLPDGRNAASDLHLIVILALATWVSTPVGVALGGWGMVAGARSGHARTVICAAIGVLLGAGVFAYTVIP